MELARWQNQEWLFVIRYGVGGVAGFFGAACEAGGAIVDLRTFGA